MKAHRFDGLTKYLNGPLEKEFKEILLRKI